MDALAALVAPLTVDQFFAEHYEKKPGIFRAGSGRAGGVLSMRDVVAAMTGAETPHGSFLIDTKKIDPGAVPSRAFLDALGEPQITLGTEPIWAFIEAGEPIVWNAARGATAALDAMCAALGKDFGGRAWPNIYATGVDAKGNARAPFDLHFDSHEVLVLQLEGEKTWQISSVRHALPLDVPAMSGANDNAMRTMREEAKRAIAIEETVGPGDVVYIPRGQFHNAFAVGGARAVGGRSLHVTFGIVPLAGLDVLEAIAEMALEDDAFRRYFPVPRGDSNGEARREMERELALHIGGLFESGAVTRALDRMIERRLRDFGSDH